MRASLVGGLFAACAAASLAAQTATPPTSASQAPAGATPSTVTMIGCVGGTGSTADPFMLSNVTSAVLRRRWPVPARPGCRVCPVRPER